MPRARAIRNSLFVLLAAGAMFTGGCGLADYEKRMDEQNAYVQLFDEENRLLGEPLEMPMLTIKEKEGIRVVKPLMFDFFLRPQKGIANKIKPEDPAFSYEKLALFRYEGPQGYNVFATTCIAAPEQKGIKSPFPEALKIKEFQQHVRGALMGFYQKRYGRSMPWLSPEMDATKPLVRSILNPQGKPAQIKFDTQILADQPGKKGGSLFYVYYSSTPQAHGAVIAQIPAQFSDDANLKRALELSINTYAVGPDATKKRNDYRRMRKM